MTIQRVLHDGSQCRVCRCREGFIRTAAPTPAPFPNPYYNRNPQENQKSEGGQFGNHWYHGTTSSSFQDEDDELGNYNPDRHDRFKTPVEREEFDGVGNGRNSEHWNTDLGTHFTGLKDVAKNSFASSKLHRDPVVAGSRIAHTSLHMANPKHYEDEKAMDDHAVSWAKDNGHHFLPAGSHDALHGGSNDFVSGHYDRVTDHPQAQHNYDDFHSVSTSHEDRDLISRVDKSSPQDLHKLPVNASALWLQHHPARQDIIEGFRQHVMGQGHDGMTYGNTYEGPKHHTSAIAFPSTPMTIHKWEPVGPAKPQRASDRDDLRQMTMFDKAASQGATFNYIHNPHSSQSHGVDPERYGQHIEPHGKYISEQNGSHVPEGWQSGSVTFHNPKRLEFGGGYQEPSNWKHRLSSEYDGKTGSDLSKALIKDGHDGIITHDKYGTSEIVDLTNFKSRNKKQAMSVQHYHLEGPHYRAMSDQGHMLNYAVTPQGVKFDERSMNRLPDHAREPMKQQVFSQHGVGEAANDSVPAATKTTTKPQYYHGTTVSGVTHILPAEQHGGSDIFGATTNRNYAYATTDPSDAWNYAEKAYDHHRDRSDNNPGHPKVYQVEPIGGSRHVEADEAYDHAGNSRAINSSDHRSAKGWKVVKELPMPEHMGKPQDWHPGGERW